MPGRQAKSWCTSNVVVGFCAAFIVLIVAVAVTVNSVERKHVKTICFNNTCYFSDKSIEPFAGCANVSDCLDARICLGKCQNNATCSQGVCQCQPGFMGTHCEVKETCSHMECLNFGSCQDIGNGPICVCTPISFGTWCQYHLTPEEVAMFNGNWYVHFVRDKEKNGTCPQLHWNSNETLEWTYIANLSIHTSNLKIVGQSDTGKVLSGDNGTSFELQPRMLTTPEHAEAMALMLVSFPDKRVSHILTKSRTWNSTEIPQMDGLVQVDQDECRTQMFDVILNDQR